MADSIKITLDTRKYKAPTEDDIRQAKQYILDREDCAIALGERIDEILSDAAVRVVTICYKYGVDPKDLIFSYAFNKDMMDEIEAVMDEIEEEIYDLILEYATRSTRDRSILPLLVAWIISLGRGNKNLHETLEGYLYKTMMDWETAIAAMMYMGVPLSDAVVKIRMYLHDIYSMPEVLTAMRRRQDFSATYIRMGGVQQGAVGISNNGSTNVVNMGKITVQMAWMKAYMQEMDDDDEIAGWYILRGSDYQCRSCDAVVGFHTFDEGITLIPRHPHCKCYCVPILKNQVE